jgi:hypothetical protein
MSTNDTDGALDGPIFGTTTSLGVVNLLENPKPSSLQGTFPSSVVSVPALENARAVNVVVPTCAAFANPLCVVELTGAEVISIAGVQATMVVNTGARNHILFILYHP